MNECGEMNDGTCIPLQMLTPNRPFERPTVDATHMTDRNRYDRSDEEAPIVPIITTSGEQTPTLEETNVRELRQKCTRLQTHLEQIEEILERMEAEDR